MKTNSPKFVVVSFVLLVGFVFLVALVTGWIVSSRNASSEAEFNTFASCSELADRLAVREDYYYPYPVLDGFGGRDNAETPSTQGGAAGEDSADPDYSTTNIQVQGVDEADIVKTNGEYIFVANGKSVLVFDANRPQDLEPIASIDFGANIQGMFIYESKLAVFGDASRYYAFDFGGTAEVGADVAFGYGFDPYRSQMVLQVADFSNVSEAEVVRTVSLDGNYNTARLIDGNVYLVSNYYSGYFNDRVTEDNVLEYLPFVADVQGSDVKDDDFVPMTGCEEVSAYTDIGREVTTVTAISLDDNSSRSSKVLIGGSSNVYMSKDNLYLSVSTTAQTEQVESDPEPCPVFDQLMGTCPSIGIVPPVPVSNDYVTRIFRLGVDGLDVRFAAVGEVEGNALNQFSMDEHSGYFRIATTRDSGNRITTSLNDLYVLDIENMDTVGSVTDLAKGERIYSVRFMGDKGYVVTFRQVDPLFVIDLSNPSNPEVEGELKIPGFSDYLHPYDQDHIIGFGREADENTGRVQGVKMALFDVSDPTDPKQLDQVELGSSGSDSEVLRDHKALLFDREKDLLVLPVTIRDEMYTTEFQGFKIYGLSVQDGFEEKASIDFDDEDNYYYGIYGARSLYVEDVLFMISRNRIKSAQLSGFSELGDFEFNDFGDPIFFLE